MRENGLLNINNGYSKGISLITLVVTIVVVLILSGVSVSVMTGENGILKQAGEADINLKKLQIRKEIILAYDSIQNDRYKKGWELDELAEELQNKLKNEDSLAVVEVKEKDLEVVYKEYKTNITDNGAVGELVKAELISFGIKGTSTKIVPVPENFVYVGGSIDEGYVISDNAADKGKGEDSADLVGNQFVWVPVEKDQKIRLNIRSQESIENIIITDPHGDEILNVSNVGTNYNNEEIEPTINGFYNLEVTTASGTEERMIDVYSLYARRMWDLDKCISEENAQLNGYNNALEYINEKYSKYGNFNTIEQAIKVLKGVLKYQNLKYVETEEMDHMEKVNQNGGFFIARYEATYENEKAASKKAIVASRRYDTLELENGMIWSFINQEEALGKAKEYNAELSSTLPTGTAWDKIMCWLIETEAKNIDEIAVNSASWGNYANDTFSNTNFLVKSGEFEETKANNIYDLGGNVLEWTTERSSSTNRITRGGRYNVNGFKEPASFHTGDFQPTSSFVSIGFRLILFM